MGAWDWTKSAANLAVNATPLGAVKSAYDYSRGGVKGLVGNSPAGQIGGQIIGGAYDATYGQGANQQKAGYDAATSGVRQAGQHASSLYAQRGQTAINRFDQAGGLAAGYTPPTYSQDAYSVLRNRYGGAPAQQPPQANPYGSAGSSSPYSAQPQAQQFGSLSAYGQTPAAPQQSNGLSGLTAYSTLSGSYQPSSQWSGGQAQPYSQLRGASNSLAGATQMRQAPQPSSSFVAPMQQQQAPAQAPYKSNTQSYYDNFTPVTGAQNYAGQRASQGYDNVLTGRYDQRSSQPYSSNLSNELGTLSSFAQGGTAAGDLRGGLAEGYGQRDVLDNRLSERRNFAGNATTTSDALGRIGRMDPSWQSDAMSREVNNTNYGAESGKFAGQLSAGQTAGGQMISDIRSGNTQAGQFSNYLKGPESASQQFLAGYNPNETRALDSTYQKLAAEGPTYEEEFYTSQLAGNNPAYNQLQDDASRRARFSSAARGGFSSGMALDNERRTTSRLAADEFANRGALAASAGDARRARLGQELQGATALDSQLLGQNSLWAGTAVDREGMMASAASQGDSLRAGLAGDQDNMLGDLAKFRDSQSLDKSRLGADLSKFGDSQALAREDLYLRGSGQQDDFLRRDQDAIDSLTGKASDRNLDRDRILSGLATSEDGTRTARMGDYAGSLSAADQNRMTYDRDLDSLAGNTSASTFARDQQLDSLYGRGFDEQAANEDRRLTAGTSADADLRQQDQNLLTGARDASTEASNAFKNKFDAAMAVGNAQAGMQMAYDMAAIGALTEAELSAIDLQLGRAGVDAGARSSFMNFAMGLLGTAGKAKAGGAFS
jgi:hypothetical protein